MFKRVVMAAAALVLSVSASAADYVAGQHYKVLEDAAPTRDPAKVEVVEAFWYGCPHCFKLEPTIKPWIEKLPETVDFHQVPAQFGPAWKAHARAFYLAEVFKVSEAFHQKMFTALHVERKRLISQDDQREFFVALGVDGAAFDKAFNSFSVNSKLRQADKKIRDYQLTGVPAIIVNGKYVISAGSAGSEAEMLKVANYLIEKEKK